MYKGTVKSVSPEPFTQQFTLNQGISDFKREYHPDFGFTENIEYQSK